MKKLLTLAILLMAFSFTSFNVNGQTKEETFAWIQKTAKQFNKLDSEWRLIDNNLYCWDKVYGLKVNLSQVDTIYFNYEFDIKFKSYFGNKCFKRKIFSDNFIDAHSYIGSSAYKTEIEQKGDIDNSQNIYFNSDYDFREKELRARFLKALIHLAKLHGGCDPNKKNPEAF